MLLAIVLCGEKEPDALKLSEVVVRWGLVSPPK